MSYMTLQVAIENGKVVVHEPEKLPKSGQGVLTILDTEESEPKGVNVHARVQLPLIEGDGSRIVNPTPDELDASLWG